MTHECECTYVPEIRWNCIKSVIEIARAGNAGNGEIAEAVMHASCFAGSAAAFFCEECNPDDPDDIFSKTPLRGRKPNDSIGSICDELASYCPDGDNCPVKDGDMKSIDWGQVINVILPLLWSLISRLVNQKA